MGANLGLTRVIAIAAVLAGCPSEPIEDPSGGGAAHAGGEQTGGSPSPLPGSPLDPVRDRALASLGDGERAAAVIVRADVAFTADGEGTALEWQRVGLILGGFGVRVFERTARGVVRDDHGASVDDPSVAPIARALEEAAPLAPSECATLPDEACAALSSLEVEESAGGRSLRRIAIATVAAVPAVDDE